MFSLFQKLFGKAAPKPEEAAAPPTSEPAPQMPSVEVAHLSLAAIVAAFPEDLRGYLRGDPQDSTVALPIPTIVKQLPQGLVKMSLASIHRQAPPGVLGSLSPGEKRMIKVPLQEIFNHVNVSILERRADQRPFSLPDSGFNLFGNSANPYELSPTEPYQPDSVAVEVNAAHTESAEPGTNGDSASGFKLARDPSIPRILAPPADYQPTPSKAPIFPPAAKAPITVANNPPRPKSDLPPLVLELDPLTSSWPEEIRQELSAHGDGSTVALPIEEVTSGLARGKVSFIWSELRSCILPAISGESAVDGNTILVLPLKLVAPAFLASTKGKKSTQKKVSVGTNIPELFNDGREAELKPPEEPPQEVFEPAAPEIVFETPAPESAAEAVPAVEIVFEGVEPGTDPSEPTIVPEAAETEQPVIPIPFQTESVAGEPAQDADSLGRIFGQPEKTSWTPAEIVHEISKMPSIS
ncbi:MAG TPA: hypothetical protein VF593_03495, partial [Chthoniobacteraceae bacterium]